jgi:hypothetical protein
MLRKVIAAALALGLVSILPSPVGAETGKTGGSGSDNDEADLIHAGVDTYQGGFRGKKTNGCDYVLYIDKALLDRVAHEGAIEKRISGLRYRFFQISCPNQTDVTRWIPDPEPRDLAPDARSALAARFLPKPEVMMAPKPDRGIVKLGEWFWTTTPFVVPDDRYSATAAVPQTGLWAKTTAVPVSLTFYPGDGNEPMTCIGPGQPWRSEYGDELPTECMYTYNHSSSVAPNHMYFEAALEVTWTVSWTSSTGDGGTLADLHTITPFNHTVKELQAIIVRGTDSSD